MSDIQAEADRAEAERHRVVNTPLPDGWLDAAMYAAFPSAMRGVPPGLPTRMALGEAERRVQAAVKAVLPLHEQMLREQIAGELRAASDAHKPNRDFAGSVAECHEAFGTVSGLWEAARIVRAGSPTRAEEQ